MKLGFMELLDTSGLPEESKNSSRLWTKNGNCSRGASERFPYE